MKIVKFINLYYKLLHIINFDKHKNVRREIIKLNNSKTNDLYDYGEGMFYQSIPAIKLCGLRNSQKRVKKLRLNNYLLDKTVLDIGTNIGAIPITSEKVFKEFIGIDYNLNLIEIANKVRDYLNIEKLQFIYGDFLEYNFDKKFDVVLSLANHTTYDKGISDANYYFEKIDEILIKGGILILESHSPLYEKPSLYLKIVEMLNKKFEIIENGDYEFGNFYDKKRKFHIFKKK